MISPLLNYIAILLSLLQSVASHPGLPNVTEHTITQNIDHFGYDANTGTYQERYFTYDKYLATPNSPTVIFFYCGNEDNVELYVNNTGLMWQLGKKMNALLVFAEHRYYGKSLPVPPPTTKTSITSTSNSSSSSPTSECLRFLTTEQATADYATLIRFLRLQYNDLDNSISIIGFGGSYGGMLGSWMRMRYPDALDGMLAASAPILSFDGLSPSYDPSTYDMIVTRDAGGEGSGAASECATNVKSVWKEIETLATTSVGRSMLSKQFTTCQPIATQEEGTSLIEWLQAPLGYMAMGNYPFASDYMTHGDGKPMVAWPMRVACSHLAIPGMTGAALMKGMSAFASVWYNRTGVNATCFFNGKIETGVVRNLQGQIVRARRPMSRMERDRNRNGYINVNDDNNDNDNDNTCAGTWNYQYCTQMVQPFASGLGQDMFYPPSPWNVTETAAGCLQTFNVQTRPDWVNVGFPGSKLDNGRFSNIIFTNGYLDPWSGGGVLRNISVVDELWAYVLPNGAHHLDLMWAHPNDPPDAIDARRFIEVTMKRWIHDKRRIKSLQRVTL